MRENVSGGYLAGEEEEMGFANKTPWNTVLFSSSVTSSDALLEPSSPPSFPPAVEQNKFNGKISLDTNAFHILQKNTRNY